MRPEQPRRILIVRVSAIGDLVFSTPLLAALRQRFPDAHIAWLMRRELAPLLRADPDLNEVVEWTPPRGMGWFAGLRELRQQFQTHPFDWVIDAQGLLKTRMLAYQAGGYRIGFDSKEPGASLLHERLPKGGDIRLIGSEYRFLAEQLTGLPSAPPRLNLAPALADQVRGRQHEMGLTGAYLVMCPFTTRPQKHWPETYWRAWLELALENQALPIVMLGGPADQAAAQRIADGMGDRLINAVGKTSIAETPAWIAAAAAVVGVDTGLTHMGVALQRPTVAIFGSTCPYLEGGAGPLRVLYEALPCSPCQRRPSCEGTFTCLRMITPERVMEAVTDMSGAAPTR